jgi:hypothetical protein
MLLNRNRRRNAAPAWARNRVFTADDARSERRSARARPQLHRLALLGNTRFGDVDGDHDDFDAGETSTISHHEMTFRGPSWSRRSRR